MARKIQHNKNFKFFFKETNTKLIFDTYFVCAYFCLKSTIFTSIDKFFSKLNGNIKL